MKKQIGKFLQFNGKNIYFLAVDGTYWIAVRPICGEIKEDRKLGGEVSEQPLHDASGRLQKMVCLPEKFIYGWLFQIKYSNTMSDTTKENLSTYKWECYQILYDHFHGAITGRTNALKEKTTLDATIAELEKKVMESKDYQRLEELRDKKKAVNASLRKMDNDIVSSQMALWKS